MELTIFCKTMKKKDGGTYPRYISRLSKKNGEEVSFAVKFEQEAGQPKPENCPCIINVEKEDASYSEKKKTRDNGSTVIQREMYIKKWSKLDKEWVDNSMDAFC